MLALVLVAVVVSGLGFVRLQVDTDPENMVPADDPVRLRNAALATDLGVHPTIVVGLFGPIDDLDGLAAVDRVHRNLLTIDGVVADATFSVASTFDRPPTTPTEAQRLVDAVRADPVLGGNVLFADEPGGALFVALTDKGRADEVAAEAERLVAAEPALAGLDRSIAGQPLAEDAFGRQMFIQMGIFAPAAGMLVFAIIWLFFRRLRLVLAAMALAMATVLITMGALVGTGNTLHIMSSMIPIFLMPIAILDSVHLLSEFHDRRAHLGTAPMGSGGPCSPRSSPTCTGRSATPRSPPPSGSGPWPSCPSPRSGCSGCSWRSGSGWPGC